jgi:hypothetical protein
MIDKSKSPSRKQETPVTPKEKAIGRIDDSADTQVIIEGSSMQAPVPIKTKPNVMEDMSVWLKEESWSKPTWLGLVKVDKPKMSDKDYDGYLMNALRWRYLRLEGDFRTGYNNFYPHIDLVTARRTIDFLQNAKDALSDDKCDALDVKNLLDMADQYMTWIYPKKYARTKGLALAAQLKAQSSPWGDFLQTALNDPDADIYSAIDITKDALSQNEQNNLINNGLQLERLQILIRWGIMIGLIMIAGLPLIVKKDATIFNDSVLSSPNIASIKTWVAILTVGIIGAVGAFLSGLLQIRRSKVTMSEYQESIIQFKLRPIVGAMFAMLVTALLTWNVLSGIKIEDAGAYILIAFLSGFSERYFLNLLKIDETDTPAQPTPPADIVVDKVEIIEEEK